MKFYSRILTLILVTVLLCSCLPFAAFAAPNGNGNYIIESGSSVLYIRSGPGTSYSKLGSLTDGQIVTVTEIMNGNWGKVSYGTVIGWICLDYASRTTLTPSTPVGKQFSLSAEGLQLIKKYEGYSQFKYWDYNHYSIGYGTTCGANDYPNGITEAEATAILIASMSSYEANLDAFLNKYGITVTQKQYDALVSFTYNLGNPWTKYDEFDLKTILINGASYYTADEIRAAFGQFIKAGGAVVSGLVLRRNGEADMFISGTSFFYTTFRDVSPRSWYYDAVEYVNTNGIMNGISNNKFDPSSTLTRAMMVTILGKIQKINVNKYNENTSFNDVYLTDWYAPYVEWAYTNNVTSGIGNDSFGPNMSISRQDLIVMLYNYTAAKGLNTNDNGANLTVYNDYAQISDYALTPMKWAVGTKIINGSYGSLSPKNNASRAETAQIMKNYMELIMA